MHRAIIFGLLFLPWASPSRAEGPPARAVATAVPAITLPKAVAGPAPPKIVARRPFFADQRHLIGVGGLGAAALFVGAGVGANLVFNQQNHEWNQDCVYKAINMTRLENCPDGANRLQLAEGLAIFSYAVGGGLAITSLLLLVLRPSDVPPSRPLSALSCTGGPGAIGISCGGQF